jgi:NAD(P)-dependent dehydrogenase (short-subunit alcohol dehydrogenase family)
MKEFSMISEIKTSAGLMQNLALQNIQGKVVVIAGGATGLGLATAQFLARRGARVFITAHTQEELSAALQDAPEHELSGQVDNSSRPESIKKIFQVVEHTLGSVDILISHAAGMMDQQLIDAESYRNLWMQEAIECMQKRGKGHIIHINPLSGQIRNWAASSRNHNMAAALRRQARELGIRVTSIEPASQDLAFEEVAQCVYESLVQPFRMDVIFLQAQVH